MTTRPKLSGALAKLDLNLLPMLVAVHRLGKVSLASAQLGMSQPAVSGGLNRLRAALGDRLFLPTPRGMLATPWCDQIVPEVAAALACLNDTLSRNIGFDASSSSRRFTLAMTDLAECHILPTLTEWLQQQAPHVTLMTVRNTPTNLADDLEQGRTDLALGMLPDLHGDLHRRTVFAQRYVCLFRKGHPLDAPSIAVGDYAGCEHVLVVAAGSGHARVDALIKAAGVERRIRVVVPHFLAVADILEASDLVATVPEAFARRSVRHFNLSFRPHPVELPPLEVQLFWHTKFHDDQGRLWLRNLIVEAYRSSIGDWRG